MFTSNPDPAAQQRELQSVYQWFSVNKPLMTTVSTQDAFALASLSHRERLGRRLPSYHYLVLHDIVRAIG